MRSKRVLSWLLTISMLVSLCVTPAAAAGSDYTAGLTITKEDETRLIVSANVGPMGNSAYIRGPQVFVIAYDASILKPLTYRGAEITVSTEQATKTMVYENFVDFDDEGEWQWTAKTQVWRNFEGTLGFIQLESTEGDFGSTLTEATSLAKFRLGFRDGKSYKDVSADTVRFATYDEISAKSTDYSFSVDDGINGPYNWYNGGTKTSTYTGPAPYVTASGFEFRKPDMSGSVSIDGTVAVGQTLTANVDNLSIIGNKENDLRYQWYVNDVAVAGATAKTYVIVGNDLGKVIKVEVSCVNNFGVAHASTGSVGDKADYTGDQPSAPTVETKTGGKVILKQVGVSGKTVQYACATTPVAPARGWDTSVTFDDLEPGIYYFFARVAETDSHKAGTAVVSEAVQVYESPEITYTAPASLTIGEMITNLSPTVQGGAGVASYSMTGTLPAGLSFNPSNGIISGTPTAADSGKTVSIIMTDKEGIRSSAFSLTFPAVNKTPNGLTGVAQDNVTYAGTTSPVAPTANGTLNGGEVKFEYKLYDAADTTYTVTKPTEVGKYTVRASSAETDTVAASDYKYVTFEITPKLVEVNYSNLKISKTYDGTTAAGSVSGPYEIDGVLPADKGYVTVEYSASTYDDANAGTNKVAYLNFQLTGEKANNYDLREKSVQRTDAEILPYTSVTDTTASWQEVIKEEGEFSQPSFVGVNSETATGSVTYTLDSAEKTYAELVEEVKRLNQGQSITFNYTFAGTGNYSGASKTGSITVSVASIKFYIPGDQPAKVGNVLSTSNGDAVYGMNWGVLLDVVDGIYAKEQSTKIEGTYYILVNGNEIAEDVVPDAGEYPWALYFDPTPENYDTLVVCSGGKLEVKPRQITKGNLSYTGPITKTYDGNTSYDLTSVAVSGDVYGLDMISGTAAFNSKDVGNNKVVTFTPTVPNGNYTLAQDAKLEIAASITPRILTDFNANSVTVTKTYDGNNSAGTLTGTVTASGIVGSDNVFIKADPSDYEAGNIGAGGNKTVTLALSLAGADKDNYSLNGVESLTINHAAITACTNADVADRTVKTQNVAKIDGEFQPASFVGVNSETEIGNITYTVDGATLSYEQVVEKLKEAAVGETKEINYTLTGTGNYAGCAISGTILVKIVSIKFTIMNSSDSPNASNSMNAVSKYVYGMTWGQLLPFKNNLQATVAGTTVSGTYKIVVTGSGDNVLGSTTIPNAGDYTYEVRFDDNNDVYDGVVVFSDSITVARKELTVNNLSIPTAPVTKDYDGTNVVPSNKVPTVTIKSGLMSGDTVAVSGTAVYKHANVGSNEIVYTPTLSNPNYVLSVTTLSIPGQINPASLVMEGTGSAAADYGTKLCDIEITGLTAKLNGNVVNGTWKFSGDDVLNVNHTSAFVATFIPAEGGSNYKPLQSTAIAPTINKVAHGEAVRTLSTTAICTDAGEKQYSIVKLNLLGEKWTVEDYTTNNILDTVTPVINGNTLTYTTKECAEDLTDTITLKVESTNYTDITYTLTVKASEKYSVSIGGISVANGLVYNGKTQQGYQGTITVDAGTVPVNQLLKKYVGTGTTEYDSTTAPTDAGTYKFVVSVDPSNERYEGSTEVVFEIAKKEVTVGPKNQSVTKGSAIPTNVLNYTGLVGTETLTPSTDPVFTCYESDGSTEVSTSTAAGTYDITWTNADEVSFGGDYAKNYTVTKASVGKLTITTTGGGMAGGGGGGGGGAAAGGGGSTTTPSKDETTNPGTGSTTVTTTETTTNKDGSVTETTTETTTNKDGSIGTVKTETTTDTKGNVTVIVSAKDANGSSGEMITENGVVTKVEASISSDAVTEAVKNGTTVALPVELPATKDANTAPGVKIEVPASAGSVKVEVPVINVTPGTVAVIVHKDGTEEIMKTSVVTENGVALDVDGDATVKIFDNSKDFKDTVNHWAKDSIDFVSSRELFLGTTEKTFSPADSTTRAQLMTVLARLDGADTSGSALKKGMEWAMGNGISDGTNPSRKITRQQLATMLWRYAGEPESNHSVETFSDAHRISDYAQTALRWAVEHGIMNGNNGALNLHGYATRAHVAAMTERFTKYLMYQ